MLDKELCKLLKIDPFMVKLVNDIDAIDDILEDKDISPWRYIELKAKRDALLHMREIYLGIKNT